MISIENLQVDFNNQRALIDINCQIPENSFISIFGPNGAGKTTLLKVLLGLIQKYKGKVSVFEKEPLKVPASWIGYVPQIKTLDFTFPATVNELVLTGLTGKWPFFINKKHMFLIQSILDKVGISSLGRKKLNELSGGQLQRTFLARALIGNPRLIILDEPTTGIDVKGERDIYLILENYRKENKSSVLMVTHDLNVTYHHSTHVILLNHYLLGFGSPQTILIEENLRRAFGHEGHEHEMFISGTGYV